MPTFEELFDTALLAFSQGNSLAKSESERLAREYPLHPEGKALLATWYVGQGEFETVAGMDLGSDPASHGARAALLVATHRRDDAIKEIEAALLLDQEHPMVLRIGSGLIGLADPERGLALARRSVELRPHDPVSYFSLWGPLIALDLRDDMVALVDDAPPGLAGSALHALLRSFFASREEMRQRRSGMRARRPSLRRIFRRRGFAWRVFWRLTAGWRARRRRRIMPFPCTHGLPAPTPSWRR